MDIDAIWAKRGGRKTERGPFHPLICHLIDVAEVSRQILRDVASPAALRWLAEGLGIDEESAAGWLVIFAGLHDIGKSCIWFQEQIAGNARDVPHGTVSTRILRQSLTKEPFGLDAKTAQRAATVIGGHHGVIPTNAQISSVESKTTQCEWKRTWPELTARFLKLYPAPGAKPIALDNARAMWLAGFISAADWVGSNAAFFAYAAADGDLPTDFADETYRERSALAARAALHDLGWLATPATMNSRGFSELFPFIKEPNDLQRRAIDVAEEMDQPGLVIIEAPMGEGKTEAALYLADCASVRWGMRGAYVALPTMATSNQMFGRVRDFLGKRYSNQFVQIQLLHGHAAVSEDVEALRRTFNEYLTFTDAIEGIDGPNVEAELRSAVASSWFSGRKQGLLSPFGVGTIDQLLLSVLPIKHFFVRLFGLSNKTVILDEVHAYDSYMTTLMERLLGWLAAMNCHVILLSATLPAAKRARLLAAYQHRNQDVPKEVSAPGDHLGLAYPRISWVSGERAGSAKVTASGQGRKALSIRWLDLGADDVPTLLAEELNRALANGGCAAVICNTVRRAQEMYCALAQSGHFADEELDLFHARFLFKDRREIEKRCLDRFGKPNEDGSNAERRPTRMVLVATQVIEQSLDLDFDLMVTELAPIDLLLQRSGRLHRHARDRRPGGLETPQLWIIAPQFALGVPAFGRRAEYVYYPHLLLRTWWEIKDRAAIQIPDDVSGLIEAVYSQALPPADVPAAIAGHWAASSDKMDKEEETDSRVAEIVEIGWPGFSGELGKLAGVLHEDEDADVNPAVQAKTRLADPSVTVVCHHGPLRQARFETDGPPVDLTEPNRDLVRRCLENSVSLSRRDIVNDLLTEGPPKPWARNSFLRSMRRVSLDEEGGSVNRDWRLAIDPKLGVLIETTKGG